MNYQVLIVDDETELAKMTAEYLTMFDVTATCVHSAAECYDFFKKNTAELVLLCLPALPSEGGLHPGPV